MATPTFSIDVSSIRAKFDTLGIQAVLEPGRGSSSNKHDIAFENEITFDVDDAMLDEATLQMVNDLHFELDSVSINEVPVSSQVVVEVQGLEPFEFLARG
ncbi:unnamed protein product [Calypogeia fissa]